MTIDEAVFTLADTETTGTGDDAQLVEVAARNINSRGVIADRFATLCKPTIAIPAEASAVHHITDVDVVDAPNRATVDAHLEAFVPTDAVVVAHNAMFDQRILDPALSSRLWLCTERLAHHLVPDAPNFKLATLFYHLQLGRVEEALHRADADLAITQRVFIALLQRYRDYCGAKFAGDIDNIERSEQTETLIGFAERPYIIARCPFGKHRGELMESVPTSYILWALRSLDDISPDLKFNFERQLRLRNGKAA